MRPKYLAHAKSMSTLTAAESRRRPLSARRRPLVAAPVDDDEAGDAEIQEAVHHARHHVATQRHDLAWCHATTQQATSLHSEPSGDVLQPVLYGSTVLVFPDTSTGGWVGARSVETATGVIADGWMPSEALANFRW